MAMMKNVSHQEIRLRARKTRETREGDRVESEVAYSHMVPTNRNEWTANKSSRPMAEVFESFFEALKGLVLAVIAVARRWWIMIPCVMPGLVPGIHVFALTFAQARRGWPGQARP